MGLLFIFLYLLYFKHGIQEMKKKYKLYIERYYPFGLTLSICILLYAFRNCEVISLLYKSVFDSTFLSAILTSLSIVFGFLLTLFGIIYTSNSATIVALKTSNRFDELINYNKTSVLWTFISVVLTSIFLMSFSIENQILYYDYFVAFWVYSTIFSLITSFRFLDLFFVLV